LPISGRFTVSNKLVKYPFEAVPWLCNMDTENAMIIIPGFRFKYFKNRLAYMIFNKKDYRTEGDVIMLGTQSDIFVVCKKLGR
jgi:hypothetical protein